jgi:hypothetical protein
LPTSPSRAVGQGVLRPGARLALAAFILPGSHPASSTSSATFVPAVTLVMWAAMLGGLIVAVACVWRRNQRDQAALARYRAGARAAAGIPPGGAACLRFSCDAPIDHALWLSLEAPATTRSGERTLWLELSVSAGGRCVMAHRGTLRISDEGHPLDWPDLQDGILGFGECTLRLARFRAAPGEEVVVELSRRAAPEACVEAAEVWVAAGLP